MKWVNLEDCCVLNVAKVAVEINNKTFKLL